MSAAKLFGNKIPPACGYCTQALQRMAGNQILCEKRGVVAADYHCRLFLYDPLMRIPKPPLPLQKFSQSDFEL